jgi:hypothetical protein
MVRKMNDYWNDPPEEWEPPECCEEIMEVLEDGTCVCANCGKLLTEIYESEPCKVKSSQMNSTSRRRVKSRGEVPQAASHWRKLERLLKQMLAGEIPLGPATRFVLDFRIEKLTTG